MKSQHTAIPATPGPPTLNDFLPPPTAKSELQEYDPNKYDPNVGFNLFFDFASKLMRQFRSMRIVYGVYNVNRSVVNPSLVDAHDGEPDPEDTEKNRIMFRVSHLIKNVEPHPSKNLIIEL